jgi:hypothetical protein
MRLWWPVWGGRAARRSARSDGMVTVQRQRGRSASRPRVARAAQAAQAARTGSSVQASEDMARVWRARESGPLRANRHVGQWDDAGISAGLVWATARAAPVRGRDPAEVWAEALDAWLTGWEQESAAGSFGGRVPDARRTHAWEAIDATLGQLRAS